MHKLGMLRTFMLTCARELGGSRTKGCRIKFKPVQLMLFTDLIHQRDHSMRHEYAGVRITAGALGIVKQSSRSRLGTVA